MTRYSIEQKLAFTMSQARDSRRVVSVGRPSGQTIQSLSRALELLETVARHGAGIAMADLSRGTGLHMSTAFHLVQTLVGRGYLVQEPQTRKYRIGPKLLQVAATATNELYIAEAAAEVLAELTANTGETSSVALLDRGAAVILVKIDGPSRVGLIERPGDGRPLHCTAIGKVLLAGQPEAQAERLIRGRRLEALTPRSITSKRQLLQELARVRSQGYAVDDEEFSQGLRCLAAPVRSFSQQVVAALSLAGPVWQITPARVPELAAEVMAAAGRLSERLGYLGLPDRKKGGLDG